MSRIKLCNIDGKLMLPVPAEMLAQLGLLEGSRMRVSVVDGCLSFKPLPRLSLEEMLSECDPFPELSEEDRQWLDAKPMGREIW